MNLQIENKYFVTIKYLYVINIYIYHNWHLTGPNSSNTFRMYRCTLTVMVHFPRFPVINVNLLCYKLEVTFVHVPNGNLMSKLLMCMM